MTSFGFVICSQNENLADNTTSWIRKLFPKDTEIHILTDAKSIFQAYNVGIELTKDCRYVCFVHEDIDVEKINVEELILSLEYPNTGFLGVAGAIKLHPSGIWWEGYTNCGPNGNLGGQAGHQKINESGKRVRWYNNYGESGRVEVLDGVILFCKRELLEVLKWDEETFTDFDFYDISITWEANRLGYENYTFPLIELYHWGMGFPRDEWEVNRIKFLDWKKTRAAPINNDTGPKLG